MVNSLRSEMPLDPQPMSREAIRNLASTTSPSQAELAYEKDLVHRARGRSPQAWAEIYERNYTLIYRYALARVGDHHTAEDLTATTFVEALKSIRLYSSRGRPLLAWLYTIARNVVNYHHRSSYKKRFFGRIQPAHDSGEPRPVSPTASTTDTGDPALHIEGLDLRDAVRRLSQDQRDVIILRYFVGHTTPEIARLLGKHERAVYSLQTRAIQALRRHLG